MVIWSAPPSYQVLLEVLEHVDAQHVYLALGDNVTPSAAVLAQKIGGLAKYAITHLGGAVDLERAAAKLGVTTKLVILGLNYWALYNKIRIVSKQETVWVVDNGGGRETINDSEVIMEQISRLLDEMRAFRSYLTNASVESLFATDV
jgi:hypothetical protein